MLNIHEIKTHATIGTIRRFTCGTIKGTTDIEGMITITSPLLTIDFVKNRLPPDSLIQKVNSDDEPLTTKMIEENCVDIIKL
jgi:hypothetical protein